MTEPDAFVFADDGAIPNSSLPLLVYRQAVPADAAAIERIFTTNRWPAAWRAPPRRETSCCWPASERLASPWAR